jgi:outer membrane protein assembly factor BamB
MIVRMATILMATWCFARTPILSAKAQDRAELSSSQDESAGELTASTDYDWPCWRGEAGTNHSLSRDPPTEWSDSKNVVWRADIPGLGHASPCLMRDRIFLASADEKAETQFLVCLDRHTGKQLWSTTLHQGNLPAKNEKNSHASATPATDGQRVYVLMANVDQLWAFAVDFTGKLVWRMSIGNFKHANGYGSSPVLFKDLVIAANDNEIDPSITALDRLDGHVVWKIQRPTSDNSATPIVANVAGRPQLLINGAKAAVSYDPAAGSEIWRVNHTTEVAACTMAFDDLCVYASGNVPDKLMLAIRADGHGDVSSSNILWSTSEGNTYVPSPLICGDRLFAVIDSGVAYCRDSRSGDVIWKHRLGGSFFASPVAAGEYVYATSELGVTHVFRSADKYELVAKNDIGQACLATPVICNGQLFLRTESSLFCIGKTEK